MKTWATAAITVGAVIVASALGGLIVVGTGAYNVAATSPHSRPVEWLLGATADRSVEARAAGLTPPAAALNAKGKEGFQEFDGNLCAMCHGTPDSAPTEIGKGLYPRPPELSKSTGDMSMAEVYWIIAHGIKDTGMPAFRAGHSPEQLWLLASFVKRMNGMSATDYRRLTSAAE